MAKEGIYTVLRNIAKRKRLIDVGTPAIANAEPVPFSINNFHKITRNDASLCFVDGGNNTLMLSPGRSVHMVRLYYSLFEDKKIKQGRYTYIVEAEYNYGNSSYRLMIHDIDGAGILPSEMDVKESLMKDEKIRGTGAYVRRIGEWLLIEKIQDKCDFVVRDGSLQTGEAGEYEYQDRVFSKSHGIIGLSKTSTLITSTGLSLVAAVQHLANANNVKAPWYYNPIARNMHTIKGDMYIVKLHPFAEYAFRAEIYPPQRAKEILGALVQHSNDPIFLGYPYGLLDADINARISDEEIKLYRNMIYEGVDDFSRLEINALNAHDIISEVK